MKMSVIKPELIPVFCENIALKEEALKSKPLDLLAEREVAIRNQTEVEVAVNNKLSIDQEFAVQSHAISRSTSGPSEPIKEPFTVVENIINESLFDSGAEQATIDAKSVEVLQPETVAGELEMTQDLLETAPQEIYPADHTSNSFEYSEPFIDIFELEIPVLTYGADSDLGEEDVYSLDYSGSGLITDSTENLLVAEIIERPKPTPEEKIMLEHITKNIVLESKQITQVEILVAVLPEQVQVSFAEFIATAEAEQVDAVTELTVTIAAVADRLHVLAMDGQADSEEAHQIEEVLAMQYEELLINLGLPADVETIARFIELVKSELYRLPQAEQISGAEYLAEAEQVAADEGYDPMLERHGWRDLAKQRAKPDRLLYAVEGLAKFVVQQTASVA